MLIKIRKAEIKDINKLSDMISSLFSIEDDFSVDIEKQKRGLRMIIDGEADGIILVAEKDSVVTGMVSLQKVVSTAAGGYSLLLEDMFVMPEHRHSGVGEKLVKEAVRWGKENSVLRIQLAADKRNTSAINFYSANGFNTGNMICFYKYI